MKYDSKQLLINQNRLETDQSISVISFPTSQQVHEYQKLAHQLRSNVYRELMGSIKGYLKSIWLNLKDRWNQRKAVAELDKLDSFMLKDIGLSSADVDQLRYGLTTVEQLNERRLNMLSDRLSINKVVNLELCKCNEKVVRHEEVEFSGLAKCG